MVYTSHISADIVSSLFELTINYIANDFDNINASGNFWTKILLEDYNFTPKIANRLLDLLCKNNKISDKILSLFASPVIFPLTQLTIDKNSGASKITMVSIIHLERHLIGNLKYLKLSDLTQISFEVLISFFFFQQPEALLSILINNYEPFCNSNTDNFTYDDLDGATSKDILDSHIGEKNLFSNSLIFNNNESGNNLNIQRKESIKTYMSLIKSNKTCPNINQEDQKYLDSLMKMCYYKLTHLDLSSNNFSSASSILNSYRYNTCPENPCMEVDSEIDFYFYFENNQQNGNNSINTQNIPRNMEDCPDENFINLDKNQPSSSNGLSPKDRNMQGKFSENARKVSPSLLANNLTSTSIMPYLTHLNLSKCALLTHKLLSLILRKLDHLSTLDLSLCIGLEDLSSLTTNPCKSTLEHLVLHGMRVSCQETSPDILNKLNNLRSLDISEPAGKHYGLDSQSQLVRTPVHLILSSRNLPNLSRVDLSGVAGLSPLSLLTLIELHPDLEFLGLMLSHVNYDPRLCEVLDDQTRITVAGESNEIQLLNALKIYSDRPGYIQKGLQRLFSFTRDCKEVDQELVQIIIDHLNLNPVHLGINLAGTACLYNLIKSPNVEKCVSLSLAKRVVETSLKAMQTFAGNQQIQKNVILLLCNDWVINKVTFDKLKCTGLVLDCLCAYKDNRMIQMCAAITSLIAAKMTVRQVNQLGSKSCYIKRLLEIIMERVMNFQNDSILKLCLSAIWNLTDESPKTCKNFIKENGLRVYYDAFQSFADDPSILTKFLGSLSNVAEVASLKISFLSKPDFFNHLLKLTGSEHVAVSYFSCGICAHLLTAIVTARPKKKPAKLMKSSSKPEESKRGLFDEGAEVLKGSASGGNSQEDDGMEEYGNGLGEGPSLDADYQDGNGWPDQNVINEGLCRVVLSWSEPDTEMVSYRSFRPFFHILSRPIVAQYGAHLWALWALRHVCSKNVERYRILLDNENGQTFLSRYRRKLESINQSPSFDEGSSHKVESITLSPDIVATLNSVLNELTEIILD